MSLLKLENIHTYYGRIHALKGVSLTVESGEIVSLIGSNGAGKARHCVPSPGCCVRAKGPFIGMVRISPRAKRT